MESGEGGCRKVQTGVNKTQLQARSARYITRRGKTGP